MVRRLSARVREELPALIILYQQAVAADVLLARARYAIEYGGACLAIGERIDLRGARHPLLGARCIPLSLAYEKGVRIVIISGPNTGGKTVLLKTVGLLSLMNQSAIPVPADSDSVLPFVRFWERTSAMNNRSTPTFQRFPVTYKT